MSNERPSWCRKVVQLSDIDVLSAQNQNICELWIVATLAKLSAQSYLRSASRVWLGKTWMYNSIEHWQCLTRKIPNRARLLDDPCEHHKNIFAFIRKNLNYRNFHKITKSTNIMGKMKNCSKLFLLGAWTSRSWVHMTVRETKREDICRSSLG